MVNENKQWNVVAVVTVLMTVAYTSAAAGAMFLGKLTFAEFSGYVLPLVTAWGGYLARMLSAGSSSTQ